MRPENRYAFKEWASICCAVAAGRQTLLVRKGGVHERRGRFAVEHGEFWLFATRFHQSDDELSPDGRGFLAEAQAQQPADGFITLPVYAVVTDVFSLDRAEVLPSLRPYHVYDDRVLTDRFHYKQPGLTLLIARAFAPPKPKAIPDSPHFAGCRSWVELPNDLQMSDLFPVLSDTDFDRFRREISTAVQGTAVG